MAAPHASGQASTIDEVVQRLTELDQTLPASDGVRGVRAEVLWHVRAHTDLFNAYFAALAETVAMECRALLVPRV